MSGNVRAYLAELVGTFALVFAAAGASSLDAAASGFAALAYAAAWASALFAFGPTSGGHFNPAVTAAMLVARRIDGITSLFYGASQLLGASLAGLFVKSVLRSGGGSLGGCELSGVGFRGGTLIEAVSTFFLVSSFMATAGARRGPARLGPLAVGLTVFFCALVTGPVTGGAMNPARAFGPSVASGEWANWFVYWTGPLAGAVTAALLHENLFSRFNN
jgi:glycerol uptake facilitator protein